MFPSAIIKKDKKKLMGAEKVKPSVLMGMEKVKSEKLESIEDADEEEEMESAKPSYEGEELKGTKSPKKEDVMSIDLMMQKARKKPANAASSEGEKFAVEKDDKGMWKESGSSKEKYLKTIGKLKKK